MSTAAFESGSGDFFRIETDIAHEQMLDTLALQFRALALTVVQLPEFPVGNGTYEAVPIIGADVPRKARLPLAGMALALYDERVSDSPQFRTVAYKGDGLAYEATITVDGGTVSQRGAEEKMDLIDYWNLGLALRSAKYSVRAGRRELRRLARDDRLTPPEIVEAKAARSEQRWERIWGWVKFMAPVIPPEWHNPEA